MLANQDVIHNWAARKANGRGRVEWHNANVHAVCLCCKSYWLPIAYYLGGKLFLKNGDKSTPTTTQHQAHVQRECFGPTIPFSALDAADVPPHKLEEHNIIAYEEGKYIEVGVDEDGNLFNLDGSPFRRPMQGMLMHRKGERHAYWHILGGCALEYDGRYFLSGMDHGSYFLCELPERPASVEDAYEILKPELVKAAERDGLDGIQRQGEWFFIPTEITDREMATATGYATLADFRQYNKQAALPHENDWAANLHVCKWVTLAGEHHQVIYAKGVVYHRDRWGQSTGQHPALKLGNVWHIVVHNTALQSWSASGNVD